MSNFSIKSLFARKQNPELFVRRSACVYLIHSVQLIKDITGSGHSYSDSFYTCTKQNKRITKKHCSGCKTYLKPNAIESKIT
jgi:hypothetical protein